MAARGGLGPGFSALLTASFITNIGDGLRLAALPLLATTLTSSPILISGIAVAQYLPWTTFGPFAGVIVDRSDRRRLIMATQAWRSAAMLVLAFAVIADVVQIWHLFVVAYLITAGEILVDPSIVATIPTLVDRSDLDRANGQINTVEVVTDGFVGRFVGAATFVRSRGRIVALDWSRVRATAHPERPPWTDRHCIADDHALIVRDRRSTGRDHRNVDVAAMVLCHRRVVPPSRGGSAVAIVRSRAGRRAVATSSRSLGV